MPETIIPPGYAQIIVPFKHAAAARDAIITFGIDAAETPVTSDTCDAILTSIENIWASTVDAQVTIGPVVARVGNDPPPGPVVEGTISTNGGNSAEQCPSNCALLVKKRTGSGGRANRGRIYIPWALQESSVSDTGVIDPTYVATVQGQMDDWLDDMGGSSAIGPMVILHSGVGLPTTVSNLVVDNLIATQRRRLGR